MTKHTILLLGSGGREHAFAMKTGQSALCKKLFVAPGNAGTAQHGTNVPLLIDDFESLGAFCLANEVTMLIPAGEDPLVKGVVDYFNNDARLKHILVIGPSKEGAQLEGSKDFSKQFMKRHNIPTAAYQSFTSDTLQEGIKFLETLNPPYVLKADGLAAGKGVIIPETLEAAESELTEMLTQLKFGAASSTVVIEEFLKGIELSVFVCTDGENYIVLPEAKDYKRVGEGDTGLNTGGMGAVSPVPFAGKEFLDKVEERIIRPTIKGLKAEKINYKGFLFIGLMNVNDDPYVIEYNCRMGDPETEVVFPRLQTDLLEILEAIATGSLNRISLKINPETAATVILVSKGYPGNYEKGKTITGLESSGDTIVFHSGTKQAGNTIITNGGRVLALTSFGKSIDAAVSKSLETAEKIQFDNKYYRRDIGKDLLDLQKQ
ncbi:MAG TPA: phosphoribosylamine--glycine ligase [Bacteroidia bacterium]|nr:phosphoribosylamine--glycine ligase [Bacteroidia bacterium]